jgi:uncharacterized protein (UPF0335 family)
MARVAQAYFHFHTRLTQREMRKFGRQVDTAARRAALRNFQTSVLINVEIEEGSLIGRVTAFASIVIATTSLVSNYKGVKDGVKEMCQDARSFGTDVCTSAVNLAGVSEKQVYRIERRTKTVGKLSRLLSDIERLEKSIDDLSPAQMRKELGRFNHQLLLIAKDLEPAEKIALDEILEHTALPPPNKWPVNVPDEPRAALKPEQFELTYESTPKLDDQSKHRPARYENSFKVFPKRGLRRQAPLIPQLRSSLLNKSD